VSGTTLIAAEQLDRRCLGLEIEPRYCDVVVQRWEQLSGGEATHDWRKVFRLPLGTPG
jgi:DNA modification methylase